MWDVKMRGEEHEDFTHEATKPTKNHEEVLWVSDEEFFSSACLS